MPWTILPVASNCNELAVFDSYSRVVFTKSDIIKIGDMEQTRYLRLLVALNSAGLPKEM